jgi:hypothetical protein
MRQTHRSTRTIPWRHSVALAKGTDGMISISSPPAGGASEDSAISAATRLSGALSGLTRNAPAIRSSTTPVARAQKTKSRAAARSELFI